MCSLSLAVVKGKHMCARSVVNKLNCGIPQWPDVMDKCQTNALTPLLERCGEAEEGVEGGERKKKAVSSVAVKKTKPQLHVINAPRKTPQEHAGICRHGSVKTSVRTPASRREDAAPPLANTAAVCAFGAAAARISRRANAEERFPLTVQPHAGKKR